MNSLRAGENRAEGVAIQRSEVLNPPARESSRHPDRVVRMAPQQHTEEMHGGVLSGGGSPGLWGALIGLIVFVFVAVPLSAAVSYATHPNTKQLFAGRLSEATTGGYVAFWWIVAILLLALPFLVGFAIAKMSVRTVVIIASVVIVFVIAVVVLGQLFVF
jgi:hypothetical protein